MHVLYDGNIYNLQATGGVNRYFANLIRRLPQDVVPHLTSCKTRSVNYPSHPNLKVHRFRRFRPAGISYRLEQRYFDYVAASRRFDVAHPTYYTLLSRRAVKEYKCPIVITVWDMIHELFDPDPERRNARDKEKAVLAADAIICISENTKKDLLEHYPVPAERVKVTHLASEIDESQSHGDEPVPKGPYFLYVGLRFSYKNFHGLLKAFARVGSSHPDLRLCVVGAPFTPEEVNLIAEHNLGDRIDLYEQVTDAHLAKLYRCSLALIYPSQYEGFGLPPLEAMSCGTPVVSSNCSSLPEVVGDAGVMFDPQDTGHLGDILIELAGSPTKRDELIAKGFERAKLFSWDKTAAQTVEIYRSLG